MDGWLRRKDYTNDIVFLQHQIDAEVKFGTKDQEKMMRAKLEKLTQKRDTENANSK